MLPTTIHEAPDLDAFTSLADHQSQTPSTFYNSKPVLHYHAANANALSSKEHVSKLPIFTQQQPVAAGDAARDNAVVDTMEIFVTSEYASVSSPTH
jgi:nucleotide-sensitive chloride channel 1A